MNELEMQQNQQDEAQLEVSMEDARETVDRADALRRLLDNADFIRIVDEGYFRDEAARLCNVKADPEFDDERAQANILRNINAIAPFKMYLRTILQFGDMAAQALVADQQTREDILEEEAEA